MNEWFAPEVARWFSLLSLFSLLGVMIGVVRSGYAQAEQRKMLARDI